MWFSKIILVRTNGQTLTTVCCCFTGLVGNDGGFQDLDDDVDFLEVSSNQLESGRSYQRWQGRFDDIYILFIVEQRVWQLQDKKHKGYGVQAEYEETRGLGA